MRALLGLLGLLRLCGGAERASLVLALMVRDEAANIRANLPAWSAVADAVVCGIDDRTSDETARAVVEGAPNIPKWVFYFTFDGFGKSRTFVFYEAWRKFSNVSHVLILDPDWVMETAPMADLDFIHRSYLFVIRDRNGLTTRVASWLTRHQKGLKFERRLHEQLVYPDPPGDYGPFTPATLKQKRANWVASEVEVKGRESWHTSNNGHSMSHKRYLFDLDLLEKDLIDLGEGDANTLYYLGGTHLASIDAALGAGVDDAQVQEHVRLATHYLQRRANLALSPSAAPTLLLDGDTGELSWASMRWLAHSFHFYKKDFVEAEKWYQACTNFDGRRVDCSVYLAKLYREQGRFREAWLVTATALHRKFDVHSHAFALNFYVFECNLPLEAALALQGILGEPEHRNGEWNTLALFGKAMLERARNKCSDATRGYLTATAAEVDAAMLHFAGLVGGAACAPRIDALAVANGNETQLNMMATWGLQLCES